MDFETQWKKFLEINPKLMAIFDPEEKDALKRCCRGFYLASAADTNKKLTILQEAIQTVLDKPKHQGYIRCQGLMMSNEQYLQLALDRVKEQES